MVFEMVVSTRYIKLWKSSGQYIFQSSLVILQHVIIFPVMGETNQLSLNFFRISNVIRFGNNVILFFDPQTKSIIYVNERLAENDRDVYNYCRKEKHFITATHNSQVRVKVSEHDKTWYPVDSRVQADAIGNKTVSSSERTEWGMEKHPTNEVNMDEKKTPAKRNRHVAFNSPSNEKQPDQSDKLDKLFNLTEKLFTLLVEKQSPPSKKAANQTKTNAKKNLMEAVIENPETKILKCQLFLLMMKHQKNQPF